MNSILDEYRVKTASIMGDPSDPGEFLGGMLKAASVSDVTMYAFFDELEKIAEAEDEEKDAGIGKEIFQGGANLLGRATGKGGYQAALQTAKQTKVPARAARGALKVSPTSSAQRFMSPDLAKKTTGLAQKGNRSAQGMLREVGAVA